MLTYQAGAYFATGVAPQQAGNAHSIIVPYDAFPTKDGYVIIAVGNDSLFQRFCGAVGLEETGRDPRFATNALRVEHKPALYEAINGALGQLTTDEVIARLDTVGVPSGPILTIDRVFENEQVLHSGLKRTVQHPTAGDITVTGFPYHFSEGELCVEHAPPLLGQQTREILAEAGYSDTEIDELLSSGAAADESPG
jgi:crotonobetainyl-CoA:carnitine CoA-transferase CaiB-like acyl-CoA transferase